jgi:hypothetical protein
MAKEVFYQKVGAICKANITESQKIDLLKKICNPTMLGILEREFVIEKSNNKFKV